ncbi:MAG: hypothetical protein JHC98_10760 [Thermoleophilaceae bacterium]|nr:hypothetical protein [Thermoleophilaceae bacterium]
MAATADDRFIPPAPIGTPYRSDPSDPAPFPTEGETVPAVPVEPAPYVQPTGLPQHEEDAPRTEYGAPPMFEKPGRSGKQSSATPLSPEARFARTAMWVGVASIFVFNIVIGPIAVIMGVMAIRRGEKQQGRLAIIYGVIGTAIGVALLVLSAAGVIPTFDEMLDDIRNRN